MWPQRAGAGRRHGAALRGALGRARGHVIRQPSKWQEDSTQLNKMEIYTPAQWATDIRSDLGDQNNQNQNDGFQSSRS